MGLVFTAPRPEQSGEGSAGHLRMEPADEAEEWETAGSLEETLAKNQTQTFF